MFIKEPVVLLLALSALIAAATHGPMQVAATRKDASEIKSKPILTGADQTALYLPLIKGKRIGILGNPSTIIGKRSLVDSLHALGVDIKEIFGPEHGFRKTWEPGISKYKQIRAKYLLYP
jgi:uncharacterized protein YbbC (DUF1343 family)